jgi:aminopeptidase
MLDPRVTKLAELLVNHSTRLSSEDTVLIHAFDIPDEVTAAVVKAAQEAGAKVHIRLESETVRRQMLLGMTDENITSIAKSEAFEMDHMTAYIALRGFENSAGLSDVPQETMSSWLRLYGKPVGTDRRVKNTKWVVLRWPTPSMAQLAGKSTQEFEDFYFKVCTADYARMQTAVQPLHEMMSNVDQVHITGPGTDLKFSLKGIGARASFGLRNIPDGECFSAPVRESMNGTIQYNTASSYQGTEFKDIRFVVEDGKIIEATAAANNDELNAILDSDEGARYFGEFALGFNPHIQHPMLDTLFDEKIGGSFHLTPGQAYDPPGGNGNKSAIHWDIVCIQRPEYGGGEIWFDDRLIRKDGQFVVDELLGLNPENLA